MIDENMRGLLGDKFYQHVSQITMARVFPKSDEHPDGSEWWRQEHQPRSRHLAHMNWVCRMSTKALDAQDSIALRHYNRREQLLFTMPTEYYTHTPTEE